MLSTISRRGCAGFLEGMDRIAQDAVAEKRLERPAIHHVAGAVEDLADVKLQPGIFEDPQGAIPIEFHQDVDVAIHSGFSSRDRTEHRGMGYAEPPQFAFVSAQRVENVLQRAGHLSTTSLADRRRSWAPAPSAPERLSGHQPKTPGTQINCVSYSIGVH